MTALACDIRLVNSMKKMAVKVRSLMLLLLLLEKNSEEEEEEDCDTGAEDNDCWAKDLCRDGVSAN